MNARLASALLLKGRIAIEEKDYVTASQFFTQAITSDPGKPMPLLWQAYAQYLLTEATHQPDSIVYQQEIDGIIRRLDRAKNLSTKDNQTLRAYILYFLGCFYYKTGNMFDAKMSLEQCIKSKTLKSHKAEKSPQEPSICEPAGELLDNIWNYVIRPPLWRWWWSSPLHQKARRCWFIMLVLGIIAPLVGSFWIAIDGLLYLSWATILVLILALPGIQRIRAKDIEVELPLPSPPTFLPSMMETRLRELESSYER